eukprot:g13731.t1
METDSLLEKEVGRENREHEKVLSRFLDEAKWKATHTLHFAFAAMVWFSQGVLITVDSLSFSAIQRSFKLKDVELGYYNAALAVGILIGCMPTSLADSMGRRPVFMAYVFAASVVACLQGIASTYVQLLLLRVLLGISIAGVWLITPTVIAESLPVKNRGFYLLLYCSFWPVGASVAVGLSKLTLPRWRMTLSMSGLPTVVAAILAYCLLPESSRFNIVKGRWAQVKKHIKTKLLADSVDANPRELEQIPDAKLGESSTSAIEKGKVNVIKASDRVEPNSCSKIWSESIGVLAKRPDQHFSFFAVASTWFFVSGASWGLSTWLPTIIERKEQGGKFGMDPFRVILFNSACDCFSIVLGAFTVERLGRKPLLMFGFCGSAIFAFCLSFARGEISTMICSGLHQMTQAIIWIVLAAFTAESFGTQLRSSVYALSNACARISMLVSTIVTGVFIAKDVNAPIYIVGCLYVAGFFVTFALPPETKGKTLKNY